MAVLKSATKNQQLISDLQVASDFFARGKGLLGRASLGTNEALWIHSCNSIHTFFMKFAIDCVFLDKKMRVKAIHSNVAPFRLVWPVWGARSVIEFPAGKAQELGLVLGEQLHVGH